MKWRTRPALCAFVVYPLEVEVAQILGSLQHERPVVRRVADRVVIQRDLLSRCDDQLSPELKKSMKHFQRL